MKNLNFMQYDEQFLSFLKKKRENLGEKSTIGELENIVKKHNIKIVDIFFLESYLSQYKCPELNEDLLKLFNKTVYLNEKTGILEDLMCNDFNKQQLKQIINSELSKDFSKYSTNEVEGYIYDLNELLRQLKHRH